MDFFGIYHAEYSRSTGGICDAPCVTKGRMSLCAWHMASEGMRIAMAEGRLRNGRDLASTLGCPPNTDAAMLVLQAYERWGDDYPRHIEGPVLTCVLDGGTDRMVFSRDRMGERPAFYARRAGSVAFSDHPDSLLKLDAGLARVDGDGLRELFGLGPARTPGRTLYSDILALEPGCALAVREGNVRILRYFAIEDREHGQDAERTVRQTRELLEQCVRDVARLNPMVLLSGGLDSTALTALLRRINGDVLSFSVDYANNDSDFRPNDFRPELDAPYVSMAVRALGTQHRTVTLDPPELARALGRALNLRGFPGMADVDTSLLLFVGQVSRYGQQAVSGECGDEVFGGYPWFRGEAALDGFPWSGSLSLREGLLTEEARRALRLSEYVRDTFETQRRAADPGPGFAPRERRLRVMQRLCFAFFMANLQERAVCMGRGGGLEILTPLCDERLAQYVYNVPWDMKFLGGQEKGLFREAVSDLLPEKLLRRRKSPYPKTCSPRYAEAIRGMALRLAADGDAPIFGWIDRDRLLDIARSDLNPVNTPWYGQLMAGPQLLGYLWQANRWLRDRGIRTTV